jgi:dTDP-4-amino-4,6-dideoxygalactose transaminase
MFERNRSPSNLQRHPYRVVTQYPKIEKFEDNFARYAGSKYAVDVSNCTAALHHSLLVAGIGEGDEVNCPSMSYKVIFEEHVAVGYNYQLTDIQASVGIKQLEKLDTILKDRRKMSEKLLDNGIIIPLYFPMPEAEITYVIENIKRPLSN